MIKEIERMEMPEWLSQDRFNFNVNVVLQDSLYYPAAGFDGDPVQYLAGNVYSFLYVDYGVSREGFLERIQDPSYGFWGYRICHQESITENQLTPHGWTVKILPETTLQTNLNRFMLYKKDGVIQEPFCEWVIFERDRDKDESHGPKRFSLLYLGADGVAAYQAIYLSNNIRPKIIAIIQPGSGFGFNWTEFRDENEIFARSVFYNRNLLPDYIIHGWWYTPLEQNNGPIWNEYARIDSEPIWSEYSRKVIEIMTSSHILIIWARGRRLK